VAKVALVIFDIGGTIIEDNGEVMDAFVSALGANGLHANAAELSERKGASKKEVIRFFVERQWGADKSDNQGRVDRIYADFKADLEGKFVEAPAKPIPGAAATFDWLKTRHIKCATTTGFDRTIVNGILRSTGWHDRFVANVCSDDVRAGRPSPYMIFHAMEASEIDDVRAVLNVGDTPLDIQAGKRAGILGAIGVLSGVHTKARLQQESPSHLISSVADLPELIQTHYS